MAGVAASIGGALTGGLGGLGNGSYGNSNSWGYGGSLGTSANQSWNSYSDMSRAYGISNSWEDAANWSNSWDWSDSENHSRTYGREASALDIENAASANRIQRNLWADQAEYNAKQAEIDREFQAYMSNTAYQRAVADLLKAGLNPILAAGNMGASTPVGAMATSGLASAHKANAYAESESYGYARSQGGSNSYGYHRGGSSSRNYSYSYGSGSGGSYGSSNNRSWDRSGSSSQYSNNARSAFSGVADIAGKAFGALKDMLKNPVPSRTH